MAFTPRALLLAALALLSACGPPRDAAPAPDEIVVAAASDLTFAFQELGEHFERETGTRVVFSFGASGQLAQQIEHGAPVDVFASADARFVDELERADLLVPGTRALYARGHLTLWTRANAAHAPERVEDLARPEFRRVAIANPIHAPYGAAAREALRHAGVWNVVQPRVVFGENVRQTLQFAESGNVDVAIVALSLAIATDGRYTPIPEHFHPPIDQALAVIRGTRHEEAARRFASLITSPGGQVILRRYGFSTPDAGGSE